MHSFETEVYYEDTDLSGFVYHANYLRYIERARSDWVRAMGVDQIAMAAEGRVFVVSAIDSRYLRPARLHDRLTVRTTPETVTGARLILNQMVERSGAQVFTARVTLVHATTEGRPLRLPAAFKAGL